MFYLYMNQLLPAIGLIVLILVAAIAYKGAFDAQRRRDSRTMRAAILGVICATDAGNWKRQGQSKKKVVSDLKL